MVKVKAFIVEATRKLSVSSLPIEAAMWLGSCFIGERREMIEKPVSLHLWRLRDNASVFSLWWKRNATSTIFFDGGSKENPEIAGAGGVILSLGNLVKPVSVEVLGNS